MPTLTYIEGFEHGVIDDAGLGICSAHSTVPPVCSSAIKRTGAYSMRANPSIAACYISIAPSPATPTVLISRFYIYFTSLPTADCYIWRAVPTAGVTLYLQYVSADHTLRGAISTTYGTKSAAIEVDTWYRIDVKVDVSANPNLFDLQVDGVAEDQLSYAQAATTVAQFGLGAISVATVDMYYDDVIGSQTAEDYPLGAGSVVALRPSADGTHNNAADTMEDQDGNDIHATNYPAWSLLDDALWDSLTDYVRQSTIGADHYAEVAFEDTAETVIQGARAFQAHHSLGTGTNNGKSYIRDGAGQETTIFSGAMNLAALQYKSVEVTIPAAGWTTASVNALLGRVGYSSDVIDVPCWDAMMLQVACEYVSTVAPTVTTTAITDLAPTTATGGGNVTDDGGDTVTDRGVCWSTSANPTKTDSHTHDSSGEGEYASSLASLDPDTLYHVRAWATNSIGTSYGSDVEFTTGKDVNAALTGVSGTASLGALVLSLALALTGITGTGAVGDAPPAITIMSASGVEATGAPGTLAPDLTMPVSGIEAPASVGTMSPAMAAVLSGIEALGEVGTAGASVTIPITGDSATGAVGNLVAVIGVGSDITIPITGVAAGPAYPLSGVLGTGAVGTVTPVEASDITLPLTGIIGTGAVGDVVYLTLGGWAATGEVGDVGPNVTIPITANAATAAVGDVTQDRSTGVGGVAGSGEVGGWNITTRPLTGAEATAEVGTLAPGNSPRDLWGLYLLTPVYGYPGSVIQSHDVALTGATGTGVPGHVDHFVAGDLVLPLTGIGVAASVGALTCGTATPTYINVTPRKRILDVRPRRRILDVFRRRS